MSNWKPGNLPDSIQEFGIDHQIWTDRDLIKFTLVAFALGFFIGVIV
jgi:hypothetical protein